jgi:hypothetical protein
MDYTPGGFINVTKDSFKQTAPAQVMNTSCAELAKFVVYESPFTVYCDHPCPPGCILNDREQQDLTAHLMQCLLAEYKKENLYFRELIQLLIQFLLTL